MHEGPELLRARVTGAGATHSRAQDAPGYRDLVCRVRCVSRREEDGITAYSPLAWA